jgi:hypothetical protein
MPKNSTIIMIRHGEKPKTGTDLAIAGQERAQAYTIYIPNQSFNGSVLKFNYLFASKASPESNRPVLTITPLSKTLNLPINSPYADKDFQALATELQTNPLYENKSILICWHHGEILKLAKALGAHHSVLPKSSNWPKKWPGAVFGWCLQLVFDANGNLAPKNTCCFSQQLMYDDNGQEPAWGA